MQGLCSDSWVATYPERDSQPLFKKAPIRCWAMNEHSFTGWSVRAGCRSWQRMPFWDPKEEDIPPAGALPPAGSSGTASLWPRRRAFSSSQVLGGTGRVGRAERKVEFIQSGVGVQSSSGASSPSGSESQENKGHRCTGHMCSCVPGSRGACRTEGLTAQDREEFRQRLRDQTGSSRIREEGSEGPRKPLP